MHLIQLDSPYHKTAAISCTNLNTTRLEFSKYVKLTTLFFSSHRTFSSSSLNSRETRPDASFYLIFVPRRYHFIFIRDFSCTLKGACNSRKSSLKLVLLPSIRYELPLTAQVFVCLNVAQINYCSPFFSFLLLAFYFPFSIIYFYGIGTFLLWYSRSAMLPTRRDVCSFGFA